MEKSFSESYAAAGVDVTAGYESVEKPDRRQPRGRETFLPFRHRYPPPQAG